MVERAVPPAIFCIGRNYADHAAEMKGDVPDRPVVFMKNPASVIGNNEPIIIPKICQDREQVDYEGELALVLGRDCRDVSKADALSCVSHYAVANDVSARWWQKVGSGGQFVRGKSFDTFCPISAFVDADAVSDPQSLELTTRVNGTIVQQAHTGQMIFPVAELIADLSRGATLLTGTIVLTGTPAGVGAGRTPPRFLRDGDVVDITIERIGTLSNVVRVER